MRKIAFNDGWTCRHAGDSGKGKPVTIPHDAMLDEKRTQESLGGINIGWFEGFDYVYEKEFSVPQEYEDFRLVFEFEGVYRNAEVYLNGKALYEAASLEEVRHPKIREKWRGTVLSETDRNDSASGRYHLSVEGRGRKRRDYDLCQFP